MSKYRVGHLGSRSNSVMSLTAEVHRYWNEFLVKRDGSKFRRNELVLFLNQKMQRFRLVTAVVDTLLHNGTAMGTLVSPGEDEWIEIRRKLFELQSGRLVEGSNIEATLSHTTSCPQKLVSIDLATGEILVGSERGWTQANLEALVEAQSIIQNAILKPVQQGLAKDKHPLHREDDVVPEVPKYPSPEDCVPNILAEHLALFPRDDDGFDERVRRIRPSVLCGM